MSLNLVQRLSEERIAGVVIRTSQRRIPFFGYFTLIEVLDYKHIHDEHFDGKHIHRVAIPGYQNEPSYRDRVEMWRNWWTGDRIYELTPFKIPPSDGRIGDGREAIFYKLIKGYRILPRDA